MSVKKIKQTILHIAEGIYFSKVLLLMLLYIKNDIKKQSISRFRIISTFKFHLLISLHNSFSFFFSGILNCIREWPFILYLRKIIFRNTPFLKKYYYDIELPQNTISKELKHFKNRNYFYLRPSQLKLSKNGYLYISTDFGIIFKNLIINRQTIHGRLDKRNLKILKPYNKIIFSNYIEKTFRKNNEVIILDDDKIYLLVHHWFNYYHWVTESLYRLFSNHQNTKDFTIVLPEKLKTNKFVQDSLSAFSDISAAYFPNESLIKFKALNFVTEKKYCDNYDPEVLKKINKFYTDYINHNDIKSPIKNEKIFISRKNAERRNIINNEELSEILTNYNFEIVDFEDYSFFEQIAIMQQTRILIGTHGAGLTNMIFMKTGAKVMELSREVLSKKDHHSKVYWRMAGVLNHSYYYQFCEAVAAGNDEKYANRKDYFNAELHTFHLIVDIILFENNLKKLI